MIRRTSFNICPRRVILAVMDIVVFVAQNVVVVVDRIFISNFVVTCFMWYVVVIVVVVAHKGYGNTTIATLANPAV